MKKHYNKLLKAEERLKSAIAEMENALTGRVCFTFSVVQTADGVCVMNKENNEVAPVEWCIKEMGRRNLTAEMHIKLTI